MAAALSAANRGWGLNWSIDRLRALAAELGSDVPFFLGSGAAICRGRGERIEPLPAIPLLHAVLVSPPEGLSTAAVYRECSPAGEWLAGERTANSLLPSPLAGRGRR